MNLVTLNANPLYHEFSAGFNWWYVVVPLVLILSFLIGIVPHWKIRNLRTRRAVGIVKLVMPVVLGFLSADLVRRESWRGLLQFCDNRAVTQGETVYTLFIAVFAMIMIYVVLTVIPEFIMLFGNDISLKKREKKRRAKNSG